MKTRSISITVPAEGPTLPAPFAITCYWVGETFPWGEKFTPDQLDAAADYWARKGIYSACLFAVSIMGSEISFSRYIELFAEWTKWSEPRKTNLVTGDLV